MKDKKVKQRESRAPIYFDDGRDKIYKWNPKKDCWEPCPNARVEKMVVEILNAEQGNI